MRKLQLYALVLLSASIAQAAPTTKLKINGKIVSTRLKTIGGVVYVPVADVANALKQKVAPMAGGLELKPKGGAYQVGNLSGKIGDVIQTQKYSFQVVSTQTGDTYATRYTKSSEVYVAQSAKHTLLIVNCTLKNILPKAQGPVLSHSYAGNTAITDYDGQSYPPLRYDARNASDFSGNSMLPGSKVDLAVIFDIPKDTKVKDLVFTVSDYFDPNFKGLDVRVSLK